MDGTRLEPINGTGFLPAGRVRAFKEMKTYKFGSDFLHPEFKKFVLAFKPALSGVPVLPASQDR